MFILDPDFNISDTVSQIQGQKDSGSEIPDPDQRFFVFLTQKIISKLSKIWSWMFIPDPNWFLPIQDPVSSGQKGIGSRIRIHNTI